MEEEKNVMDMLKEEEEPKEDVFDVDEFEEQFDDTVEIQPAELEEPKELEGEEAEDDYFDEDNTDDESLFKENPLKAIWLRIEDINKGIEALEYKLNEIIESVEEEEIPEITPKKTEEIDKQNEPIN